jgi:hypothetical protein
VLHRWRRTNTEVVGTARGQDGQSAIPPGQFLCLLRQDMACSIFSKEIGAADVNQARTGGCPTVPRQGMWCGPHQVTFSGSTPLMAASYHKHKEVVVWLIKHAADAQATFQQVSTAADLSGEFGAPAEQTAYLEARTYCANPSCEGAGSRSAPAA